MSGSREAVIAERECQLAAVFQYFCASLSGIGEVTKRPQFSEGDEGDAGHTGW